MQHQLVVWHCHHSLKERLSVDCCHADTSCHQVVVTWYEPDEGDK